MNQGFRTRRNLKSRLAVLGGPDGKVRIQRQAILQGCLNHLVKGGFWIFGFANVPVALHSHTLVTSLDARLEGFDHHEVRRAAARQCGRLMAHGCNRSPSSPDATQGDFFLRFHLNPSVSLLTAFDNISCGSTTHNGWVREDSDFDGCIS